MVLSMGPTRRLVLAGAAFLLPRVVMSEPAGPRRIAFLAGGTRAADATYLAAFRERLRTLGHGDQDVAMEIRYADGHMDRLSGLAAELVRFAPEVIVAVGGTCARAAKEATTTIPIVMTGTTDPVGIGLIASLAHPGGNVTGLSIMQEDMAGKLLELLKTAIPHADRIAILLNPDAPWTTGLLQTAREAARTLGTDFLPVEVRAPDEIDGAFANMTREKVGGVVVTTHPVLFAARDRIVHLAADLKLPAIYGLRAFPEIGGLMSYGLDQVELRRHAAVYVDKILRGEKPADLPVEQPTKIALVINLKTAKALRLEIPPLLLARADEVIE